jgi:hypothetical protein
MGKQRLDQAEKREVHATGTNMEKALGCFHMCYTQMHSGSVSLQRSWAVFSFATEFSLVWQKQFHSTALQFQ